MTTEPFTPKHVYHVKWKEVFADVGYIDKLHAWANEHIGKENYYYNDLGFYFRTDEAAVQFMLRWQR